MGYATSPGRTITAFVICIQPQLTQSPWEETAALLHVPILDTDNEAMILHPQSGMVLTVTQPCNLYVISRTPIVEIVGIYALTGRSSPWTC